MTEQPEKLYLAIVSDQAAELDEALKSHVFARAGGSVGRSADSDWTLPDAERVLSGRHAVVEFEDGRFHIRDCSTNGTFLNGSSTPIGDGNRQPLALGDRVTIGRYALRVADPGADYVEDLFLDSGGPASADVRQGTGTSPPTHPEPMATDAADAADLLRGDDAADPLLALARSHVDPDEGLTGARGLRETLAQDVGAPEDVAPRTVDDHVASHAESFEPPSLIPDDWNPAAAGVTGDATGATGKAADELDNRPNHPVVPQPAKATAAPPPEGSRPPHRDASLHALLEGLGLEGHGIPEEAVPAFCRSAGRVLRECIGGIVSALQARGRAKQAFRVSVTQLEAHDNNPLKYAVDADEALFKLFADRRRGYLAPAEAVHAGFVDLAAHERAVRAGMESALQAILADFDPGALEKTFATRGSRSLLKPLGDRHWRCYRQYYGDLLARADARGIPARFESAFAEGYEAGLRPDTTDNRQWRQEKA